MSKTKEFLRKHLRKIRPLKFGLRIFSAAKGDGSPLRNRAKLLGNYRKEWSEYKKLEQNKNFKMEILDAFPCVYDRTANTGVDPVYFFQDTWCAKKIFESKPARHADVGSLVEMVGIVSQFVPTIFVDIRPIDLDLPGLEFKQGSATELPFADDSLESLSSICVIEHIGLGRYGDKMDQFGTEKAMEEFKRVLAPSGSLYVSVPIDKENKIYFNAHRAFTREYVLKMAAPLKLVEEKYIYGREMLPAL